MKDSYLISSDLFCQRRGFSLEHFVRQNKELNFNDVRNYFLEKDIEPPAKNVFTNIQEKIALEQIPIKEEIIQKSLPIKTVQKKRRRRKSKND